MKYNTLIISALYISGWAKFAHPDMYNALI